MESARRSPSNRTRRAESEARRGFRLSLLTTLLMLACGGPAGPSVPNVQGFYRGGWSVSSCTDTGVFASLSACDWELGGGHLFTLRVTQSDRSLQGFINVCESQIEDATGTVETDGTVLLSGQAKGNNLYPPMALSDFRAAVRGTAMTGSFVCTVYASGSVPGTISMTGTLKDVTLLSPDPNLSY